MQKIVNKICRKCGEVIEEVIVKRDIEQVVSRKLCIKCKKLFTESIIARNKSLKIREDNSKRMTDNNPMKDINVREKVSKTTKEQYQKGERISSFQIPEKMKWIRSLWKISDEGRSSISKNMIDNNPMKDVIVAQKMSKTFKERIKSGEIKYKHGKEHHLWKGNRWFNDVVRCQLYPIWTFKILERDKFTCQKCGNIKDLQVHHLTPLRSFIKLVRVKYNIKFFSDIDSDLWQPYVDEIIKLHKIDDGITVCGKCHSLIDKKYNYNENKKNHKRIV